MKTIALSLLLAVSACRRQSTAVPEGVLILPMTEPKVGQCMFDAGDHRLEWRDCRTKTKTSQDTGTVFAK